MKKIEIVDIEPEKDSKSKVESVTETEDDDSKNNEELLKEQNKSAYEKEKQLESYVKSLISTNKKVLGTVGYNIYVKNADGRAKFDILPESIVLVKNDGMKIKDIKAAEMVLEENRELAIEKWNEYFGRSIENEDF